MPHDNTPSGQDNTTSTLICGARILTLDAHDQEHACADILVRQGRIAAIGNNLPMPAGTRVIDAKGLLAMPGLINSHFHSPGNFLKGTMDGLPLELFMLFEVPPLLDSPATRRLAYLRTLQGALEMIGRGITTVHDDAYHLPIATEDSIDDIMHAYADAGIRASVSINQPEVIEYHKYPFLEEILPPDLKQQMRDTPRQSGAELLVLYQHLLQRWHGAEQGRLAAALSCSAPQRVTPEYFQSLSDLGRRFDLPLNVHVLETRLQRVLGEQKFGKSLVRYMHDLGVLDERIQLIHGIWIDDADIKLLAESGCTVAHNPVCNLRLGSGIMPYRKLRAAGVPISIGTDELCSDDTPNLWFAGKTAALVHTLETTEYLDWPKANEILQAMTRGGAKALRRDPQLGQLVTGAPADLILVDLDTWHFTPLNDLQRQLIYCEDGSSVRYTMVNGEVVYERGRFPHIDEPAIRREIRELSAELRTQFHALEQHAGKLMPYYRRMYLQAQGAYSGLS